MANLEDEGLIEIHNVFAFLAATVWMRRIITTAIATG